MFKGLKINTLLEDRGKTKVDLCNIVGITTAGLHKIITGASSPGANILEGIADYFEVPIDYFFERKAEHLNIQIGHHINGSYNEIGNFGLSECQKEREHLQALINEKDKIIEEKERTIQILIKQK